MNDYQNISIFRLRSATICKTEFIFRVIPLLIARRHQSSSFHIKKPFFLLVHLKLTKSSVHQTEEKLMNC